MLTAPAIRAAKPKDKRYKLYDERGLYLAITPAGSKQWRMQYWIGGREKLLALGVYPDVSLKRAREKRDEALELSPLRIILLRPPQIQNEQPHLQHDQGDGLFVPAPDDPQHIAEDEGPEAPVAAGSGLRGDQPGGGQGDDHGGPLQQRQHVHEGPRARNSGDECQSLKRRIGSGMDEALSNGRAVC